MFNKFISSDHEEKFLELASKGNKDRSYLTLYYAISGNEGLYNRLHKIMSDDLRSLIIDFDEENFLNSTMSSSEEKILKLAINLFNNNFKISVSDTFSILDNNNIQLCLNMIEFRFKY